MFESYSKNFRFVVHKIARFMLSAREQREQAPGVVFLLGAGCSMQYGLPSFHELLVNIYTEISGMDRKVVWQWELQTLRIELEREFQSLSAKQRRKAIGNFFPAVHGRDCPGYVRLARLRKRGLVRAILSMNFDVLLEDACKSLRDKVEVRDSLREMVDGAIYKVHGSIEEAGGKPIIAIDESDLFHKQAEQQATTDVLTSNHVVVLGYSGGDFKILEALHAFQDRDPEDFKLFVVNPSGPSSHLARLAEERKGFCLTGPEAYFENFMEALEYTLDHITQAGTSLSLPDPSLKLTYSTSAEQVAAAECRKLALGIRASINVAEAGPVGIIDHGEELFELCRILAKSANISLTSPEKYLILCAGYLHDLGYFQGYSSGNANENPGWMLLKGHGKMTAELLGKHLSDKLRRLITPATYSDQSRDRFIAELIELCLRHSLPPPGPEVRTPQIEIEISGVPVRLRPDLVQAVFATAEELAEGHPFFPSPDPIEPEPEGKGWMMEDPVLDLYLHRKKKELQHEITPGRVLVEPEGNTDSLSAAAGWLLTLSSRSILHFDRVARRHGGRGVQFAGRLSDQLVEEQEEGDLIRSALEESLGRLLDQIRPRTPGESRSIFDLLAIFTLGHPEEPRLDAQRSQMVRIALRRVRALLQQHDEVPQQSTLELYFLICQTGQPNRMAEAFLHDFREVIYPAWRFCAHNLREGIDAICLTRLVLDLGSTPFRGELAFALRHLATEKNDPVDDRIQVHEGCALCTSRSLYIFSYARLLFGSEEPSSLATGKSRGIDSIVQGLLRTLLSKKPASWWGEVPPGPEGGGIRSADYAGWGMRALAFCLAVDSEIQAKAESPWLPNRPEVIALLAERMRDLCTAELGDLLSDRSEEPHSYVIGDVAVALLETKRFLDICPDLTFDWMGLLCTARETIKQAVAELDDRNLSLISRLHLWPAKIFLHQGEGGDREALERELLDLHRRCSRSPIWNRSGGGKGSWGYNVENTQRLVSGLNLFWRYAYENRAVFEPRFEALEN